MRIRYIKAYLQGHTNNDMNSDWTEIKAIDYEGNNIAYQKPVTGSFTPAWGSFDRVTDGITEGDYSVGDNTGKHVWVQVDLEAIYSIDYLHIWHYNAGARRFKNIQIEVSKDGTDWKVIFDSNKEGMYDESTAGRIFKLPFSADKISEDTPLEQLKESIDAIKDEITIIKNDLKNVLISNDVACEDNDTLTDLVSKAGKGIEEKNKEISEIFARYFDKSKAIGISNGALNVTGGYSNMTLENYIYTTDNNDNLYAMVNSQYGYNLYKLSLSDFNFNNTELLSSNGGTFNTYYSDLAFIDHYLIGYYTTSIYKFDLNTNTGTSGTASSTQSYGYTALIPYNNNIIYRFGGRRSSSTSDVTAYRKYDISTNTWTNETSIGTRTYGYYDAGNTIYFDTRTFDKTTDTYTTVSSRGIGNQRLVKHPYDDNTLLGFCTTNKQPCSFNATTFAKTLYDKTALYSTSNRNFIVPFYFKGMLMYFGLEGYYSEESKTRNIAYYANDIIHK